MPKGVSPTPIYDSQFTLRAHLQQNGKGPLYAHFAFWRYFIFISWWPTESQRATNPTPIWAATNPHIVEQQQSHITLISTYATTNVYFSRFAIVRWMCSAQIYVDVLLLTCLLDLCCSNLFWVLAARNYVGHSEMNINEFLNKSKWYNEPPPFCCRWAMSYSETAPVCIATSIYKGFSLSVYIYNFFSIRSADLLSY
jgi:hypothetical protein